MIVMPRDGNEELRKHIELVRANQPIYNPRALGHKNAQLIHTMHPSTFSNTPTSIMERRGLRIANAMFDNDEFSPLPSPQACELSERFSIR